MARDKQAGLAQHWRDWNGSYNQLGHMMWYRGKGDDRGYVVSLCGRVMAIPGRPYKSFRRKCKICRRLDGQEMFKAERRWRKDLRK